MDQSFPLCFCILQAIKNWMVGRPGNEAIFLLHSFKALFVVNDNDSVINDNDSVVNDDSETLTCAISKPHKKVRAESHIAQDAFWPSSAVTGQVVYQCSS